MRKSTDGVWKVKATHSECELASLWSLALAEEDWFKSPPGGREGDRLRSQWIWRLGGEWEYSGEKKDEKDGEENQRQLGDRKQRGVTEVKQEAFRAPVISYLSDNPQSKAALQLSVQLQGRRRKTKVENDQQCHSKVSNKTLKNNLKTYKLTKKKLLTTNAGAKKHFQNQVAFAVEDSPRRYGNDSKPQVLNGLHTGLHRRKIHIIV